ncbi:DNA mismatch repair protein MutS [Flavicella sp.]|nr:DNA mismatch repair protein MutS [Flavicella sp.]
MKFAKGDRVVVVDATTKGVVVRSEGTRVLITEENGFDLYFDEKQLVKVVHDQFEMSKYSDINNALLHQKLSASETSRRKAPKKRKKEALVPPMEVDLHIQHLVKNHQRMSNFDMLNLQLDTAKYKLEFAIRKRIPRLVFIHGVGEGVLRSELGYLLAKYPVKISEASYQKYGMGATEVYILQNKNK